jgi:pilus assembly protein CpaF
MVDARLPDGSRVNAVVPPASPRGPIITIRKFFKERLGVTELVAMGSLTPTLAEFLRACVRLRLNIIISGGTGTGKTTLLNVLSGFIPEAERIVTIEDTTELQLQQPHVVGLEARPPSLEGTNEITLRDLVKNSLRMRPDRIIVGEVRSGEAFDMLQAMNTGHEGSIGTVHANSPRDCMARLENMILMAGFELPIRAIREQITSAIHLVVQLTRFRDGTRRITQVTEVQGMENQTITMQDIFVFQQRGVDENGKIIGELVPTGLRPKFAERFEVEGIQVPADLFVNSMTLMAGSIRWGEDK